MCCIVNNKKYQSSKKGMGVAIPKWLYKQPVRIEIINPGIVVRKVFSKANFVQRQGYPGLACEKVAGGLRRVAGSFRPLIL